MRDSFYLAWKYLAFYKWRSALLIISIGTIIFLPNGLRRLIEDSEAQLMDRANTTPLIVGAKGSASDLVINTLYFQQERIETISQQAINDIAETGLGQPIPVYSVFNARRFPIVGTDLSYFEFRKMTLAEGRLFSFLGECVIGADVAQALDLKAGDHIVSSPENFFDLAGVYPLKMLIVGVLDETNSPDDKAIFTDLKTTWVIEGLGHGHEDLEEIDDPSVVLKSDDGSLTATAKLKIYQEITEETRDKIHFHGDPSTYPISSLIVVPKDEKSGTILRGRFESGDITNQITVPTSVIDNLLQSIFRIKQVFDLMFVLVGVATVLIFILVVALSLRLREDEINTLFILGSNRGKILQMLAMEVLLVIVASGLVAGALFAGTGFFVDDFIQRFVLG